MPGGRKSRTPSTEISFSCHSLPSSSPPCGSSSTNSSSRYFAAPALDSSKRLLFLNIFDWFFPVVNLFSFCDLCHVRIFQHVLRARLLTQKAFISLYLLRVEEIAVESWNLVLKVAFFICLLLALGKGEELFNKTK